MVYNPDGDMELNKGQTGSERKDDEKRHEEPSRVYSFPGQYTYRDPEQSMRISIVYFYGKM